MSLNKENHSELIFLTHNIYLTPFPFYLTPPLLSLTTDHFLPPSPPPPSEWTVGSGGGSGHRPAVSGVPLQRAWEDSPSEFLVLTCGF